MAFSTELVLAAQTGPGVDYQTVPTSVRTSTNTSWSTVVSTSVNEGTWLVVYDTRPRSSYQHDGREIRVNSGTIQRFETPTTVTPIRFMDTVSGPGPVVVEVRYYGVEAGTLHLARIG